MRPTLIAATLAAALVAGACGDLLNSGDKPGIRVTAGAGITDTISARLPEPLTVAVTGNDGEPAAGVTVFFTASAPENPFDPSMHVVDVSSGRVGTQLTAITDAAGEARVRVWLSGKTGPGKISVTVPELGFAESALYTVTPGAPARTQITPRDTIVYIGGSAAYRGMVT
ncbi:MAG TPA: hypothetical protein VE913_23615, partial [Longimicrobium sp.]|nr:hypothetical protein [Longimicrobium sp.]